MKKIKGLLLFGILTFLGIGSSFGYIYTNYQFEFKSNNNNNILFNINPGNSSISSYLMTYQDSGGTRNSVNILKRSSTSATNLFNISSYTVSSFSPSYSYSTVKLYSSSSCLDLSVTGSSYQLLFHLFGSNNCNSTSNSTISSREVYVNVGDSCINNGVINTGNCDYGFYKYFGFNGTFDSRFDSLIQDNQYSGSNAGKTSISFPFPDTYSFFNSISWSGTGPYELPSVYIYNQKYIYHTGDSFSAINGLYITRINDLNSTFENSDFQVIALDLTGIFSDGDLSNNYFIYGIFDCPYSAQDILDCSFNDGGTISNLYTANSITGNVFQFLTTRDGFSAGSTYNYFSNFLRNKLSTDGILTFYRLLSPSNANTSQNAPKRISTSVQLVSDGNNYFQDLFLGGNGNQSIYSGTVSLNNCIDTQICWDYTGSQGNIIRMCTTECVSSGVIASGGYIGSDGTYYFVNSPISIEDSLKTDNPENMFTGSYIESGGILSLSYFTDYFQPGAKKVGVCPFKYYEGPLDFMTKLKIGDVYLLMPVLCFYSAFQQGKNVSFFDQYNVNDGLFSQPMLYGESDNHKLLFAFFDVLFSIGLLGLIRYLSRHLF